MLNDKAPRLSVQMRGSKFADKPFADFENQTKVTNLETYYKGIKFQK